MILCNPRTRLTPPRIRLSWLIAIIFAALVSGSPAHAQSDIVGGIDLGDAGPGNFGILALGGSGAAGFGSSGTSLDFTGSTPQGYVEGAPAQANVGIGMGSSFGGAFIGAPVQGVVDYYSGDKISGQYSNLDVQDNTQLTQAATDASTALAQADSLAANVSSPSALTSSYTFNPTNPGGLNVVNVSDISLGAGANVTFGGPAGTNWVVIDSGNLAMNGSGLLVGSNLNSGNLLLVVNGSSFTTHLGGGPAHIDGTVILPTGSFAMSGGIIDGSLIVGGSSATFSSGGYLTVPPNHNVPEPCAALLWVAGLGWAAVQARSRRRKATTT